MYNAIAGSCGSTIMRSFPGGGGGALVFEVGYHPHKKIQVIRVVFQDQAMYNAIAGSCGSTIMRSFPGGGGHLYLKLDIILIKKFK